MSFGDHVVDCPDCGRCRLRVSDIPARSYVDPYPPQGRDWLPEDDEWSVHWPEPCLWCGRARGIEAKVPPGAQRLAEEDLCQHLRSELERFAAAGGAAPLFEIPWRTALADHYVARGDHSAALEQLGRAEELTSRDDCNAWFRMLRRIIEHIHTDEHRLFALARIERAIAAMPEVAERSILLLDLARLHAQLRDFHAAWGAAKLATDEDLAATYELISIGAMLELDTSEQVELLRERRAPTYGQAFDDMVARLKGRYR